MSSTTILEITRDNCFEIEELPNGRGAAPVIWDLMCQKYYKTKPFGYREHLDLLWPRYKDLSIPLHERAVLMMTFDLPRIDKKNFKRAANDIREFFADHHWPEKYVNHWPRIADILEGGAEGAEAIGIYHTSVFGNPYLKYDSKADEYLSNYEETYEIYLELEVEVEGD